MNEKFCLNCPCLNEHDPGFFDCRLLPMWKESGDPPKSYCYLGRQIMEKEATWKGLKACYPGKNTINEEL